MDSNRPTSDNRMPPPPPPGAPAPENQSSGQSSGPGGTARERGSQVADTTRSEAGSVAHDATEEARGVAHEAQAGVRDVVDEARNVVHDEADRQTHTLSGAVRRLADDLTAMSRGEQAETQVSDYVERAGSSLRSVAERLDSGGIDGALDEMRQIARRHPGMFLTGAAASGFATARLLRHANAPTSDGAGYRTSPSGDAPGEVDLRDEYAERSGEAPRLQSDVQEWARP